MRCHFDINNFEYTVDGNTKRYSRSFCVNGGTCKEVKGNGRHVGCDCREGWTGEHCEENSLQDQPQTNYDTHKELSSSSPTTTNTTFTIMNPPNKPQMHIYGALIFVLTLLLVSMTVYYQNRRNMRRKYELQKRVLAVTSDLEMEDDLDFI